MMLGVKGAKKRRGLSRKKWEKREKTGKSGENVTASRPGRQNRLKTATFNTFM
jgi:hypothetical protein